MVSYHPAVQKDVSIILEHYDDISPRLGDAFWTELLMQIELAEKSPFRFHFGLGDMRRANLKRFPYHFLFRVTSSGIRILVIRHHKRHPSYGSKRR